MTDLYIDGGKMTEWLMGQNDWFIVDVDKMIELLMGAKWLILL